jgi:hypothetical protein
MRARSQGPRNGNRSSAYFEDKYVIYICVPNDTTVNNRLTLQPLRTVRSLRLLFLSHFPFFQAAQVKSWVDSLDKD